MCGSRRVFDRAVQGAAVAPDSWPVTSVPGSASCSRTPSPCPIRSREPGKLADFVVLLEDVITVDPEHIVDVEVDMTVLGEKIVYQRLGQAVDR